MNIRRMSFGAFALVATAAASMLSGPGAGSGVASTAGASSISQGRPQGAVQIDGETNPQDIPDVVGYRMFLRTVADLEAKGHHAALQAYLRRGGVGAPCPTCDGAPTVGTAGDVAAIVRVAREFVAAESTLIREFRERAAAAGRATVTAAVYRQAKEAVASQSMDALQRSVPAEVATALDAYIQGHIKSRIKIVGTPAQ